MTRRKPKTRKRGKMYNQKPKPGWFRAPPRMRQLGSEWGLHVDDSLFLVANER
jgi:hypothetical protein